MQLHNKDIEFFIFISFRIFYVNSQILTTLQQPTSGYAIINGFDIIKKPKYAKSQVSLMSSIQLFTLVDGHLTRSLPLTRRSFLTLS